MLIFLVKTPFCVFFTFFLLFTFEKKEKLDLKNVKIFGSSGGGCVRDEGIRK